MVSRGRALRPGRCRPLALLRLAAETAGTGSLAFRGHRCDPFAEAERLSVAEAFARHAGIDLLATLDAEGQGLRDAMAAAAARAGHTVAGNDGWADIFSRCWSPPSSRNWAKDARRCSANIRAAKRRWRARTAHDPRVAERFELYVCGVELANGFGELTDSAEQRRRFAAEMAEKERVYGERYPLDEDFLYALDCMPEASGVALGFDRLVMLATGGVIGRRDLDAAGMSPVSEGTLRRTDGNPIGQAQTSSAATAKSVRQFPTGRSIETVTRPESCLVLRSK